MGLIALEKIAWIYLPLFASQTVIPLSPSSKFIQFHFARFPSESLPKCHPNNYRCHYHCHDKHYHQYHISRLSGTVYSQAKAQTGWSRLLILVKTHDAAIDGDGYQHNHLYYDDEDDDENVDL